MPLFDFLLIMVIIVTLYLGPMVLRRLGPGQRTYGWMLIGDMALAILALAARKSEGPGGLADLLGTVAVGVGVCLVFVPPLLRNLARRALAGDRMRLARWLVDMRELLQPGMGARQESELISTIIEVRTGNVDAAVERLRKQRDAISEPILRRPIDERIVMTYLYARRWDDASSWYEEKMELRSASPQLSVEMVRAYCERGEMDKAAELVEQLEGVGAHGEPLWTLLLNRARLVFLAFAGRTGAVEAIMGPSGPLGGMPEAARCFWHGMAQLRAGDRGAARSSLERAAELARSDRRARELAQNALARIDEPGMAGPHPVSQSVADLADRLTHLATEPVDSASPDDPAATGEPADGDDSSIDVARTARARSRRRPGPPRLSGVSWRETPVTSVILVANLLIAVALYLQTGSAADLGALVSAGANVKWAAASGDYWRLVASMFLHVGVLHLLLNMYGLWVLGKLVEQFVGSRRTLVIYVLAGVSGSLASLWFGGPATSAGASGAVFGLLGAAVAELALHRGVYPKRWRGPLLGNLLFLIAANVVIGFMYPLIDQSAHIGGLVVGLVLGALLSRNLAVARRDWMSLVVTGCAIVCVAVLAYGGYGSVTSDFARTLARAPQVERTLSGVQVVVPAHWEQVAPSQLYDPSLTVVVDLRFIRGRVEPGDIEAMVDQVREQERKEGARQAGFDRATLASDTLFRPPQGWISKELIAVADGGAGGVQHFRVAVVATEVEHGAFLGSLFFPVALTDVLQPTLHDILAGAQRAP